ncbi:MAG: hypothetical protein ABSE42_14775 [Bryobacteraceae bacterium]|jgi:hypothetical protein
MCFLLYAGTMKPIPRIEFDENAPNLNVVSLNEHDAAIRTHFSQPEVQYIGSTSCCGCDFPHLMMQNGEWPFFRDPRRDAERDASDRHNMEALVGLLLATREKLVELYGIWDGNFAKTPRAREDVSLESLLDPDFHFKEGGFYTVSLEG